MSITMQTKILGHRTDLITFIIHVPILRVLTKRKICFYATKINSKVNYEGRKSTFQEAVSILYRVNCLTAV